MSRAYTAAEVRRVFLKDKVTQRKLDYWDEQGILSPTGVRSRDNGSKASGRGNQRLYTYTDLVKLKVLVELRRAGLSLQKIRQGLRRVSHRDPNKEPLLQALVTDGKNFFLKRRDGSVEDLLSGGQLAFGILALDEIERDVSGKILRLERRSGPSRKKVRRAAK